jgi:hypothetical protein
MADDDRVGRLNQRVRIFKNAAHRRDDAGRFEIIRRDPHAFDGFAAFGQDQIIERPSISANALQRFGFALPFLPCAPCSAHAA